MAAYTIVSVWNSIYATFINGTGRIKMEMVAAVFGGLLNIPLSVFLVRNMGMGVAGIPASACISLLMFAVLAPIQTVRMTRTA
jgi:Na+-driven multidrug efflux pump